MGLVFARLAKSDSRSPIFATFFVLAVWLGWSALEAAHLGQAVADDVRAELGRTGQASIAVTLAVLPERFHAQFFRNVAPFGGRVKGRTYFLYDVPSNDVDTIGRQLWVTSVTRWDGT